MLRPPLLWKRNSGRGGRNAHFSEANAPTHIKPITTRWPAMTYAFLSVAGSTGLAARAPKFDPTPFLHHEWVATPKSYRMLTGNTRGCLWYQGLHKFQQAPASAGALDISHVFLNSLYGNHFYSRGTSDGTVRVERGPGVETRWTWTNRTITIVWVTNADTSAFLAHGWQSGAGGRFVTA